MPYSYNGWYASPNLATRPLVVAGEAFVPGVLDNDDVHTVLQYVAQQMHERVEPIVRDDWHQMDDWGYNYRLTTNDTSLSNHSSGTAIDYNATRHPFGVSARANFTDAQIAEIHKIINVECWGLVAWGGDYRNTPDAMHFDINGTAAEIAKLAAHLRNNTAEKDWFDMATKEELREVVREVVLNQTPSGAQIRDIVREEIDAQFNEQVTVNTPTGTRRISYTQLFKELWQKLNKHT